MDRLAGLLLPLRRYDLLAPLTSILAASDQAKVRTARNDMMADTMRVYGEVRRAREKLGDLAYPEPASLKEALEDAARRMSTAPTDEVAKPAEQLYFREWLKRLTAFSAHLLSHATESFRQSVLKEGHSGEADILCALDEERYADAVFLRSEAPGVESNPKVARRQTDWRKWARTRFAEPRQELKNFRQKLKTPSRGSSDLDELIEKWLAGVTGSLSEDQRLRTKFADVVFADTFLGEGEQIRGQGKSERSYFWIPCQRIQGVLAPSGTQPKLPPPTRTGRGVGLRDASCQGVGPWPSPADGELGRRLPRQQARRNPGPQDSTDQRSALLHELRQRKLTAAVVDDLDLCRLLNVGGRQINLVIGILEVMLEQQRWIDSSPFHAHDGAQARIEMYVGRAQEANVLATDNKYSRLFSGRKLGKSALLKFIEDAYDGFRLPSGNTLRLSASRSLASSPMRWLSIRCCRSFEFVTPSGRRASPRTPSMLSWLLLQST